MSITEKLPQDYRFGAADVTKAYNILVNCETPTDTQKELMTLGFIAEDMHRSTGLYPTLAEAVAQFDSEQRERERNRIASWRGEYIFTQQDFDTLAEEDSGPMFDFVSVAKHLKTTTGRFPNVAEVRALLRRTEQR